MSKTDTQVKTKLIIDHARLHQPIEVIGAGAVGPTLNKTTIPGIQMELIPQGLLVNMKNKAGKACKPTIIPLPNIAAMQLAE